MISQWPEVRGLVIMLYASDSVLYFLCLIFGFVVASVRGL